MGGLLGGSDAEFREPTEGLTVQGVQGVLGPAYDFTAPVLAEGFNRSPENGRSALAPDPLQLVQRAPGQLAGEDVGGDAQARRSEIDRAAEQVG